MSWWQWVLAGFLLLGLEFVSTTMHVGFFAVGAFLVALLVALGWEAPLWQQLIVFTVTSLVAFFFLRPIVVRKLRLSKDVSVDEIAGEEAVVIEDIPVGVRGKAELRGSTWSAQNVGSTPLTRGQRCTVERVEGLLLHIKA